MSSEQQPVSLKKPPIEHAVFQPNQILRNTDLTDYFNFLDTQMRLSRVHLSGVGIVSGLNPHWDNATLHISAGCGTTSQGYLISLETSEFKQYRDETIAIDEFQMVDDSTPGDPIDVLELAKPGESGTPLTEADAKSKVVVLLASFELKDASDFGDIVKGKLRHVETRVLLVDPKDAEVILEKSYGDERFKALKESFAAKEQIAELLIERVGWDEGAKGVSWDFLDDSEELIDAFKASAANALTDVTAALEDANKLVDLLFADSNPEPLPTLKIQASLDAGDLLGVQCCFSSLKDLIRAYEELVAIALEIEQVGIVPFNVFPNHLVLGQVDEDSELSYSRTLHVQPDRQNENRARIELARLYFNRIKLMVEDFEIPDSSTDPETIRISPSKHGDAPLGERAIPFYYKSNSKLPAAWNSELHRGGNRRVYGYHQEDKQFKFDLEECDFFRVEGHVGKELEEAVKRLEYLRSLNSLPFEILVLRLGEADHISDGVSLETFRQFNVMFPGAEHKSGVPRGGTLILVYESGDVVTDFCLPYVVEIPDFDAKSSVNPFEDDVEVLDSFQTVLKERDEARLKELDDLSAISGSTSLPKVEEFIKKSNNDDPIDESVTVYADVVSTVAQAIGQSTTNKEKFKRLAEIATREMLDRLSIKATNAGQLESLKGSFKSVGGENLAKASTDWISGINDHPDSGRVDAIVSLLKSISETP